MRTFWRIFTVVMIVATVVLLVLWWQTVIVHASQETGTSDEGSRAYAYWSGFGSVFPWSLAILGSIVGLYKIHFECHSEKCHWPVVHTNEDGHKLCKKCVGKAPHELKLHFIHPHHAMTAEQRLAAGIHPETGELVDPTA